MYLDPGFGSMLIQLIIAGLAGLSAAWFAFRRKLSRKHPKDSAATVEPAAQPVEGESQPMARDAALTAEAVQAAQPSAEGPEGNRS